MVSTMMNEYLEHEEVEEPVQQPSQLLARLVKSGFSGKVTLTSNQDQSIQWQIFMGNGKIDFATSTRGKRERISYLLNHYFPSKKWQIPDGVNDEYQFFCHNWQTGKLSTQEVRKILAIITQEALIQCLSLPKANTRLENLVKLDPLLISLSVEKLIIPVQNHLRLWVQMQPKINSPFQRPVVENLDAIKNQTWINNSYYAFIKKLATLEDESLCIYEIAQQFKQNSLKIANLLQPLVNFNAVKMLPYQPYREDNRPIIACIDDSKSVQKTVKMTLEMSGFKVINISEPAIAMTMFVTEKPHLILMDVNMPSIDGYKLSSMLRQSTLLRDIPIVMLTGRDGIIDRARAKMVGAVNFISKPFMPQELVNIVTSCLNMSVNKI